MLNELEVRPLQHPLDATVRPPGSKSITNRALICAALARGETRLDGILVADDTEAMLDCLAALGVRIDVDRDLRRATVRGSRGAPPATGALLDARLSGTTSRFIAPVAALARGVSVLDGAPPLRARPMGDLFDALEALGAQIEPLGDGGCLPVQIEASGLAGGTVSLPGDVSSQFLSALLLAGPEMDDGLRVQLSTDLVSKPYVDLTLAVMADFGAHTVNDDYRELSVAPVGYRSLDGYRIEPDASAASYFFAAAAICGGTVRVEGLGTESLQGDVAFVDALEEMGALVTRSRDWIEVTGTGRLRGIDADFTHISDTAQTLAVVAACADSPTSVRGIGFIRHKETDRISAVVNELQRLGITATEDEDGFTITPGPVRAAVVQTYHDHRMAMSFALLGLKFPGVTIADPGCVEKTFPQYWDELERLRS